MAATDLTKKLLVYHTLYLLNRSFSKIVTYCAKLQQAGILNRKDTRIYQGYTQELQCEINERLLEIMRDVESDDWARFGKIRQAEEKRVRDPDDGAPRARKRRKAK
jgi:hypothetical protein